MNKILIYPILILMQGIKYVLVVLFILIPEASTYLFNVIVWRISKKKYLGKSFYFKGRQHKIIGETYHHFYIYDTGTSFLKDDYKLTDYYLMKRPAVHIKKHYWGAY